MVGKGFEFETMHEWVAKCNKDFNTLFSKHEYILEMNAEASKQLTVKVNKAIDTDIPV